MDDSKTFFVRNECANGLKIFFYVKNVLDVFKGSFMCHVRKIPLVRYMNVQWTSFVSNGYFDDVLFTDVLYGFLLVPSNNSNIFKDSFEYL